MLLASAALGFTGVGLGALGSHALRDLPEFRLKAWNTAVQYQLLHTVAIFASSLALRAGGSAGGFSKAAAARLRLATQLWLCGTILFSGSIYGLVLAQVKLLGPVTPIGGVLMMCGWIAVGTAAVL